MKRKKVLTVVSAATTFFAVTSAILAAPSPEFGPAESPHAGSVVTPDDLTPVDPVVEEPLRPLLLDTSHTTPVGRNWCGPVGLVTGLTLLLLLCTMRAAPTRFNC